MKLREMGCFVRLLHGDRTGAVAILVGVAIFMLAGFSAIVVDVGYLLYAQRSLQASTDAAALAGAEDINVGSGGTAVATAIAYSAASGGNNANSNLTVTMATGYPLLKCLTSTGIACAEPDSANAIVVEEQATVPLYFARLLGINSWRISAIATASAKGGVPQPLDVMVILDTTESMNDRDTGCAIAGSSRLGCALSGVRTLLDGLWPCSQSLASCGSVANGNVASPVDEVGLMVFPGLTTASQAQYDYDCSTSKPAIAKYSASPVYQVIALSSNYRTSDISTLNSSSDLVIAAGGASSCSQGLSAVGGMGTFYADAITAAQNALAANTRINAQNVIIFLSDGGANASASNMPAAEKNNQCHEAIAAAAAAAAAGTWVYSVAYGSSTSTSPSTCTTDSPAISACVTMQQIASAASKFFSDNSGGAGTCASDANSISDLSEIFQYIGIDATNARLLPDSTQ